MRDERPNIQMEPTLLSGARPPASAAHLDVGLRQDDERTRRSLRVNHSRRAFLKAGAAVGVAASRMASGGEVWAQSGGASASRTIQTSELEIGYEEVGPPDGFPVLLLHGFPDDIRAWDDVVPPLAAAGYRVIVPYLRGCGSTRFLKPSTFRTGEQAAIGQDVLDLADALHLPRFALAGYDWGGRAACVAAALHPERVRAAVLIGGYTIQDVFSAPQLASPERERALRYQWYFNTERGRIGLERNRRGICRLLWETWSPTWRFTTEVFERTAAAFDNPDFVDVSIHSYRHRNLNAPGDPRFETAERQLVQSPTISVPTIVLYGADDGLGAPPRETPAERALFTAQLGRRVVEGAGHFVPRERPNVVSSAVLEVLRATK